MSSVTADAAVHPPAQAVPFFRVVLFVFPVVLFIKIKQLGEKMPQESQ